MRSPTTSHCARRSTGSPCTRPRGRALSTLMGSRGSKGDLAAVIEQAVTEKLERLEANRFARTRAPREGHETKEEEARTADVSRPQRLPGRVLLRQGSNGPSSASAQSSLPPAREFPLTSTFGRRNTFLCWCLGCERPSPTPFCCVTVPVSRNI